jgi:hypothetical protein
MKYGRLPAYDPVAHPRMMLGPALRPAQLTTPSVIDEMSDIDDWPMFLNDQLSDCTIAAAGHMIEAWTRYGRGLTVKISTRDVLTAYSAVSGYNPATGVGDNGAVMQDVLGYWRKVGIGGHKILAFAELDVHNPTEVAAALFLFGHVYVGLRVPASAETQFATGEPWDVITDDGGIQGRHAVNLGYRSSSRLDVVTWAERQQMTLAFWSAYVDEAWVVVDEEWISATGGSPPGLDTSALNAQYTALTGQPGPFPVAVDPDVALATVARPWVTRLHTTIAGNRRMQNALKTWLKAKGL